MTLTFRSKDVYNIRRRLLVWKTYFRICLALYVVNEDALLAQKRSVVLARN